MNQGESISHQFIHTCPMFEPLLNEIHHFSHYSQKFIYRMPQFDWVWHFLESVELTSHDLDALCKAFHCFMRFFLGLEMLQNLLAMLFASKTEKELTWYAISMQENIDLATEFSLVKSDSGHVCFSFQGWFTSLMVFPIPITISTPLFVEPRWPKMCLNLSKFSTMLVNCRSKAVKVESEAYD